MIQSAAPGTVDISSVTDLGETPVDIDHCYRDACSYLAGHYAGRMVVGYLSCRRRTHSCPILLAEDGPPTTEHVECPDADSEAVIA